MSRKGNAGIPLLKRAGAQLERVPLRWRLALLSFGLLALLLGGLCLLITVSEEQTLLANQAQTLRDEAKIATGDVSSHHLTLHSKPFVLPMSSAQLQAAADALVGRLANVNTHTRAALLTPDGVMLAPSTSDTLASSQQQLPVQLPEATLQQAVAHPPPYDAYLLAQDSMGQRELVVLTPLSVPQYQNETFILELSTPTWPIDRAVAATRVILALGILVALGIAAVLIPPLVSAALRPLVVMDRASRRIAEGALSLRLREPPTDDEIGRLARSFNAMVAQLDAAFARQKRFVADVSHELRTPLTALSGGLEMLLLGADQGDPEASRRLLRGMYAEVERMRRLAEDLLTLTRLDEGRAGLRMAWADVGPLISEVCAQVERLTRGQEVRCEVAPELPLAWADADRLRQVLLNCAENAIKFTPPPGEITLSARAAGGWVELAVRDTGVGIASEALPHVFDRFYRADASRARSAEKPGGSGLGLAIAKSLIEAQNGEIGITSEPGTGTTVTIRLRAQDTNRQPSPVPLNRKMQDDTRRPLHTSA